ncbi:MAG: hypothetical protein KGI37_00665 [Alphaproteobacteria bacterium]|nr:hypothetical protein [Alphaproteobacteria bacterium]
MPHRAKIRQPPQYPVRNVLIDRCFDNLLALRPTLRPLAEASNLEEYLAPVLAWQFQPHLFPNAQLFLDLVGKEIGRCYGGATAAQVTKQLKSNFTVETGMHVSLPRLHDRATVHSIPLNNVNTLIFQATLYSAAARLAAGQPFHISCSSGHISLSNINSGAYFQPDVAHCLRLQPNKLDGTPQTYLPPLTVDGVDKILHGKKLSGDGLKRVELFRQNIRNHPDNFSRQIATTHAALYNQVLPDGVRQITFDFELVVPAYLIALLKDPQSLTYRLFSTLEGRDFLRSEFNDVITAWKTDVPPFDVLEERHGHPHVTHAPYLGSLSPDSLCEALGNRRIIPKTALSFVVFMLEAGLAPVGGMRQTHYATQIRDKLVDWLRREYPDDPRIEALSVLPADRAILSPLWGVNADFTEHPISYREALNGWKLDKETAHGILNISGASALAAGAVLMDASSFGEEKIPDDVRQAMLREIAETTDILKCAGGYYEP